MNRKSTNSGYSRIEVLTLLLALGLALVLLIPFYNSFVQFQEELPFGQSPSSSSENLDEKEGASPNDPIP